MKFEVATSSEGILSKRSYASLIFKFDIEYVPTVFPSGEKLDIAYVELDTLDDIIRFINASENECIFSKGKIEIYDYLRE